MSGFVFGVESEKERLCGNTERINVQDVFGMLRLLFHHVPGYVGICDRARKFFSISFGVDIAIHSDSMHA